MRDLVSAPTHHAGLTNPLASAFRKLGFWLQKGFGAARQGRLARIDPDRWSDAMLKDIGLEDLTHRPTDWRLLR
jgi:hypothetical protein